MTRTVNGASEVTFRGRGGAFRGASLVAFRAFGAGRRWPDILKAQQYLISYSIIKMKIFRVG